MPADLGVVRTTAPTVAARRPAPLAKAPAVSSAAAAVLALQRTAGNAAVVELLRRGPAGVSVQRVGEGTAPTALAERDGLTSIRAEAGRPALGVTDPAVPPPPGLALTPTRLLPDGTATRAVMPVTAPPLHSRASYPAAGLHDIAASGVMQHKWITPAASDRIRQGEQEHTDDAYWAYQLVTVAVTQVLNRLAAAGPVTGADGTAVEVEIRRRVAAALPPALRAPETEDPGMTWGRALSRLIGLTWQRDSNGWHRLSSVTPPTNPAELARYRIPSSEPVDEVLPSGGQIGQHDPEQRARTALAEVP